MSLDRTDILPGKGETRCNRTACQAPLPAGLRWWNRSTRAWYCKHCAFRIMSGGDLMPDGGPILVIEHQISAPADGGGKETEG